MEMSYGKTEEAFFRLLRMGLGRADAGLPVRLAAEEWERVWKMAREQALTGVVFDGVCQLPEEDRPPKGLVFRWLSAVQGIEQANRKLNRYALRLSERFRSEGFRSVILKGQGNALWYPNPLHRTPGDIDIWLEGGRERIMAYVRRYVPNARARYHHVDFPVLKDVEVEVHFTPSWLSAWGDNRRLQHWFAEKADEQFAHRVELPEGEGSVSVPTPEMNRILLLLHIYRHFFEEGVGMRQLTDYVLLLERGCTEVERKRTVELLEQFRLKRFAAAVMYILQKIFGMEERFLLVPPSEKEGELVLREIMRVGNFGQYNAGICRENGKSVGFFLSKFAYRMRFLSAYPRETLWGSLFWVWQRVWRIWKGYAG